jgi:hypothetical protein
MSVNYQVKPPSGHGEFDLPEFLPSIIGIVIIAIWALSIGDAFDWGPYAWLAQLVAVPTAIGGASVLAFFSGWGIKQLAVSMALGFTAVATWAAYYVSDGFILPILTCVFVLGDQVRAKRGGLLKYQYGSKR